MTLNSTSMARPPPAANDLTTGHARAGGVKHQVKPTCQPSAGVGQHLGRPGGGGPPPGPVGRLLPPPDPGRPGRARDHGGDRPPPPPRPTRRPPTLRRP